MPQIDSFDQFQDTTIQIVDYGFASRYLQKESGNHIKLKERSFFQGNLIFASYNQLCFNKTSRKDDLISLVYLITYLVNHASLPGIDCRHGKHTLEICQSIKKSHTADNLCIDSMRQFHPFVDQIFNLEWQETPNYMKLRRELELVKSMT